MDTPPGITVALQSYPGADLTLPYGSQLLTPHQSAASQSLDLPELRSRIQTRLRQERAASADLNGRSTCRLLLLLPDKTRRQNATRLTLDALLELAEQEQGWSVEIVFGLGTHPLMNDADIAQIVGHERLQKIKLLGVRLQQQTTLCSLPVRTITVPAPPQLSGGINGNHESAEVHLNVPEILWHSDIILVAGDTDLHPYEGRGGSGGINKMIAIGIGCLNTIRMTHCMDILTHSQTRPGEEKNRFVEMVDYFAAAIIKSAMHPAGSLHQKPLGISVIARHSDQPEAFWIGSCEQERASLLKQLKKERTLELRESVNIVITDTETAKATDLLAGARSLHFLCLYDDNNNRLISESSTHKTAIMYNQCHQISNANGIGNTGTVLHLNALKTFALEALRKSQDLDPTAIPNDDQTDTRKVAIARQLKHAVLSRWEQYLQLVSEEDQVFAELEQALVELQKGKAKNLEVIALIYEILPHSFGEHRHVLEGTRMHLVNGKLDSGIHFFRKALEKLGFKGLGEGGQRALRLLIILRKFDQLLVATHNSSVLDFLNSDRLLQENNQQRSRAGNTYSLPILPFELIGLSGISLLQHSPQEALNLAIDRHRQFERYATKRSTNDRPQELSIALLQEPVILSRSPSSAHEQALNNQ